MTGVFNEADLSSDLNELIGDSLAIVTVVVPTVHAAVSYPVSKHQLDTNFDVGITGREPTRPTTFVLNAFGVATIPEKGWHLWDGTATYKVDEVSRDAFGVAVRLDCIAVYHK